MLGLITARNLGLILCPFDGDGDRRVKEESHKKTYKRKTIIAKNNMYFIFNRTLYKEIKIFKFTIELILDKINCFCFKCFLFWKVCVEH